jgi:hypothetical protein
MARRDKLEVRLGTIKAFYEMYKNGILGTGDEAKQRAISNATFAKENNGLVIYESEIPKVQEKYPDINIEEFVEYATFTELLKSSSSKKSIGGVAHTTRLNTAEAATERGVVPEYVNAYIAEVEQIYVIAKSLNSKMTGARVSFAIPRIKAVETAQETVPQDEATAAQ